MPLFTPISVTPREIFAGIAAARAEVDALYARWSELDVMVRELQ